MRRGPPRPCTLAVGTVAVGTGCPSGFQEMRGAPAPARISKAAEDEIVAAWLFDASERMTGLSFGLPSTQAARGARAAAG